MLRIAWLLQLQSSLYLHAQTKVIIMISLAQLHLISYNYTEVMVRYIPLLDNAYGCHVYIK